MFSVTGKYIFRLGGIAPFTGHAAFFGVSANTFGHAVRGEGAPKVSMLIAVVMLLTSVKKVF